MPYWLFSNISVGTVICILQFLGSPGAELVLSFGAVWFPKKQDTMPNFPKSPLLDKSQYVICTFER